MWLKAHNRLHTNVDITMNTIFSFKYLFLHLWMKKRNAKSLTLPKDNYFNIISPVNHVIKIISITIIQLKVLMLLNVKVSVWECTIIFILLFAVEKLKGNSMQYNKCHFIVPKRSSVSFFLHIRHSPSPFSPLFYSWNVFSFHRPQFFLSDWAADLCFCLVVWRRMRVINECNIVLRGVVFLLLKANCSS